ncbi:ABC transporter ATP-binding protein [Paenibacillus herberti]|uniref:Multidrug ABC transporter ATP-binding protein n=1 Tax=Paenibacillus herberti TaxID=1619309 RepID=A0A229P4L8_9BACL|nr:ABC transporter ATP-binding protein [Paenibacillus herberti]OXM17017.1 multidrug ABC transporter ATP-binding protein [Paenibacillus herberti]
MSDKASKFKKPKNKGPMGGGPGGPGMMMPGEKAKDFKGTFRKLISYLGPYKIAVAFVILFAIGSTIFNILGPKILGEATTKVFEGVMNVISGTGDGIDFGFVGQIMIILVSLYIISALFAYIQGYIMSNVAMKVTYNLRRDISEKIHKLPLKYFDKKNYGEVLSHITNDVDAISNSLNQSMTQIITSVTSIIGILIMMLTISWQMTLVALCVLPLSFILIMLVVKKSQKHFVAQQESLGHVNGHIEEMYGSHMVMKAFNGEEQSLQKFDEHNEELYKSAWKSQFLSGMMMPIMSFIGNLGYVAICILGGYLAVNGRISVGDIQAFIQYMRQFTQPIAQVANISNVLQQTAAAAERVFEFLAEEEEPADTTTPASASHVKGSVTFENVHFGYNPEKSVINNFTASVKPGQKVAIVGPTGAGKTTIIKLLMRFYDIQDGAIMIDGTDIRDFARNDLRSLFGMVLQDTWLYNNTVKENIRYGKLDATDEEIYAAAKAAQVDHFIRTLPDGYDMVLNEEASNMSQGQKQLLTIARAILSNPQMLILDEATSSVDTRTEILIQKAMANLMKGRTSFVIAHRLSTIRDADLIFVMKDGDIIEQGTHDELLAQDGFYESLYNSQFSEGEEEVG